MLNFKLITFLICFTAFNILTVERNHLIAFHSLDSLRLIAKKYSTYGVIGYTTKSLNTNFTELDKSDIEPETITISNNQYSSKIFRGYSKVLKSFFLTKPVSFFTKDVIKGHSKNSSPSLWNDMKVGLRLLAYNKIFTILAAKVILSLHKNFDVKTSPPQFAQMPGFSTMVFIGPVIEELIFTYGLNGMIKFVAGPIASQIIVPTLFALGHTHQSPELQTLLRLSVGFQSFICIRNLHLHPQNIFASMFAHVLNNGVGYIFLKLR